MGQEPSRESSVRPAPREGRRVLDDPGEPRPVVVVAIVVIVAVARRGLRGGRHVGLALRGHAHTL